VIARVETRGSGQDGRRPMRFIVEFDGPLFDVRAAWHLAHQAAAGDVGWSRLDQATFWRLTRAKGVCGEILPGARDAKLAEYQGKFSTHLESDGTIELCAPQDGVREAVFGLARHGPCVATTMGSNIEARLAVLDRSGLRRCFSQAERLSADPRRRPTELKALAQNDKRAIVAAATDAIIRSAEEAGLFTVGISSGTCSASQLHAAGAGVVFKNLGELVASLQSGGADLVRAGLLPAPLG